MNNLHAERAGLTRQLEHARRQVLDAGLNEVPDTKSHDAAVAVKYGQLLFEKQTRKLKKNSEKSDVDW
jgi:hypothetical protein